MGQDRPGDWSQGRVRRCLAGSAVASMTVKTVWLNSWITRLSDPQCGTAEPRGLEARCVLDAHILPSMEEQYIMLTDERRTSG